VLQERESVVRARMEGFPWHCRQCSGILAAGGRSGPPQMFLCCQANVCTKCRPALPMCVFCTAPVAQTVPNRALGAMVDRFMRNVPVKDGPGVREAAAALFGTGGRAYNIIYADPPWSQGQENFRGGTGKHYATMSDRAIEELPVGGLAAEDCALFMWTTNVKIEVALRLIRSWGFKMTAVFLTWIKVNKGNGDIATGVGHWSRSATELILLGTRGKVSKYRAHTGLSSVLVSERREHSRKPDQVRDMIVSLLGDIPRIELFSRTHTSGWDIWGNQTDTFGPAFSALGNPLLPPTAEGSPLYEKILRQEQQVNSEWIHGFIRGGPERLQAEWEALQAETAPPPPPRKHPAAQAHIKRRHFSKRTRYTQRTIDDSLPPPPPPPPSQ